MSDKKKQPEFSQDEKLLIGNMVSAGAKMKDAKAKVLATRKKTADAEPKPEKPKKKSADDRKKEIAVKIQGLGGEHPPFNASVAKFEEALTAARSGPGGKPAKKDGETDEAKKDGNTEPDADLL